MSSIQQVRALHDFKEVRVIARALRIPIKENGRLRREGDMKKDIEDKVLDSGSLLFADWFKRIRSGRTPWKQYFDPIRKYTKGELETIAGRYGIPLYNKSIQELRREIGDYQINQQPLEEKFEQEEKAELQHIQQYNPIYNYDARLRKAHISFNNLPVNASTLTQIINTAVHANNEQLGVNLDMDVYERYVTLNGTMSVSSYLRENNQPVEDRVVNMSALSGVSDRGTLEEKTLSKWLQNNDDMIQNRVSHSDEYAEINIITELDIYFKYVQSGGSGSVSLKEPDRFQDIYCPETQKYCLTAIFDHHEIPFKEGYTLHKVINELNITDGFIPVRKIKDYLKKLDIPVKIVLHNPKDGIFTSKYSNCSRIKTDDCPANAKELHIGHIMNHYFSVTNPKVFDSLTANDFICSQAEDEHLLKNLDTSNPVKTFDWKLMRESREGIINKDNAISMPSKIIMNRDIQARINKYKKQDKNRPEYELSVKQVRKLLDSDVCHRCGKEVSFWDWTLDRIDNTKGHSMDNVQLCCRHCNVSKKDNEQQLFFWDFETPYQELIDYPYSVGITPDKGYFQDIPEFYQSLYDSTIVYFDSDPIKVMEKFENWIMHKLKKLESKSNDVA